MIVSVVIAALLKLRGDSSHMLTQIQQRQQKSDIASFLLWNRKYTLDDSHITLYNLVEDFDLDDDVRRKLKTDKIDIRYNKIDSIELEGMVIEMGTTELLQKDFDLVLQRVLIE